MIGLACGIAAVFGLDGFSIATSGTWRLVFLGPVIVAVLLIIEGLVAVPKDEDEAFF